VAFCGQRKEEKSFVPRRETQSCASRSAPVALLIVEMDRRRTSTTRAQQRIFVNVDFSSSLGDVMKAPRGC